MTDRDRTVIEAHDQARALLRLTTIARAGQLLGARKAIVRKATALLASGLLTSAGRETCKTAIWAASEAA